MEMCNAEEKAAVDKDESNEEEEEETEEEEEEEKEEEEEEEEGEEEEEEREKVEDGPQEREGSQVEMNQQPTQMEWESTNHSTAGESSVLTNQIIPTSGVYDPPFPRVAYQALQRVIEYIDGMQTRLFTARLHTEVRMGWEMGGGEY